MPSTNRTCAGVKGPAPQSLGNAIPAYPVTIKRIRLLRRPGTIRLVPGSPIIRVHAPAISPGDDTSPRFLMTNILFASPISARVPQQRTNHFSTNPTQPDVVRPTPNFDCARSRLGTRDVQSRATIGNQISCRHRADRARNWGGLFDANISWPRRYAEQTAVDLYIYNVGDVANFT